MDLDSIEGVTHSDDTNTSKTSSDQILGQKASGRIGIAHYAIKRGLKGG